LSVGPPTIEEGPPADQAQVRRATTAAVIAVIAFGFGPIIVKDSGFEALAFAFWRIWLAGTVYVCVLYARGRRLSVQTFRTAAPGGVAFGLDLALFFSAVQLTSIANATLIATLQPIPLMIIGQIWFGERVRTSDVAWTAAAIGGVIIVVIGSQGSATGNLTGDLLAAVAMLAYAGYFVATKQARRTLDTGEYMAAMMLVAGIVMTPLVLLSGQSLVPDDGLRTWLLVVAMVAVPGTGHVLNNYALKYLPLLVVALLTIAAPVVSIVLAWLILDESLVLIQVIGIIIVIGSLSAYNVLRTRRTSATGS
jgi:drug/metabolite transporter (DMT)-like permease